MATCEAPNVTEKPIVCSSWLCPYVQRLSLALAHKQVSDHVTHVEIDLFNKPDWLPRFSPLGKVPSVTYMEDGQQQVLIESLVLLQWAQEYFAGIGPSLVPPSPAVAARMRIIISRFDSGVVGPWYKLLTAKDEGEAKAALDAIHKELEWVEGQMSAEGPFLMGSSPTLADAACAPWLMRKGVLQHWRGVDITAGHPKLQAWLAHYESLPEVQSTYNPPAGKNWIEAMCEVYAKYAGNVQMDCSKI